MRLIDKVAVITGAGSGVGRATTMRFLAEGARVVAADARKDWVDATLDLARAGPEQLIGAHCDVRDENDVESLVEQAVSTFGRLDVMHNNAGITGVKRRSTLEDYTSEEWQRLVAVNVSGVFFGCKHAIRQLKRQGSGGVILNTGSVAGMVGFGSVLYGATKGAVNQITRGLAVECAPHDIRVNAICPGAMPLTNFSVAEEKKFQPADARYVDLVATLQPLGRPITAEDCAEAAVYLCSDEARNVTGVLLPIDGGYVAQ